MKNLEIRTIEHKGVKVRIKIDYDKGLASILDLDNQKKHFIFAERGLEYMNGWLLVAQAITLAMEECKKELERDLAEKSKFKEQFMVKVTFPKKRK